MKAHSRRYKCCHLVADISWQSLAQSFTTNSLSNGEIRSVGWTKNAMMVLQPLLHRKLLPTALMVMAIISSAWSHLFTSNTIT